MSRKAAGRNNVSIHGQQVPWSQCRFSMSFFGKSCFDYRLTYAALLQIRYYSPYRIIIESVKDPVQALGSLGTNVQGWATPIVPDAAGSGLIDRYGSKTLFIVLRILGNRELIVLLGEYCRQHTSLCVISAFVGPGVTGIEHRLVYTRGFGRHI